MKDKRNILVYRNELLPYSETFIKEQTLALKSFHPILVGEKLAEYGLDLDGMDVIVLFPPESTKLRFFIYQLFRLVGIPDPWILKKLKKMNPSLVHAHFGLCAVDIWPYVKKMRLPMLVTLHGYDITTHKKWWYSGHGGLRRRRYPQRLLALSKDPLVHFVAVSQAIKQKAIEYGICEEKLTVSYIGVDTKTFFPTGLPLEKRRKRILFVGRLVEKKGVCYLIEAFAKAKKKIPDAELVIIGDGPLKNKLLLQTKKLNIDGIFFIGALNGWHVRKEMEKARILCLPSITASNGDAEGFGLVLLEAQSSGLPVITSALGGATEGILDGVTGFFMPEKDTDALQCKIECILENKEKLRSMSNAATNFVRRSFDMNQMIKNVEYIYGNCLKNE